MFDLLVVLNLLTTRTRVKKKSGHVSRYVYRHAVFSRCYASFCIQDDLEKTAKKPRGHVEQKFF